MSLVPNLEYGLKTTVNDLDPKYINATGETYSGNFSSNIIPGIKGGSKSLKRKIKNITKQYKKMKRGTRYFKKLKRSLRKRLISRRRMSSLAGGRKNKMRSKRVRFLKGGYAQFGTNQALATGYSTGGINLSASNLGQANPVPFTKYGAEYNYDTYRHGFQ